MVAADTLNPFFNALLSLKLGKIWSLLKVNRPARPVSTLKHTSPIAWVMRWERSRAPIGFVYLSEDCQRLIYTKYDDDEGTPYSASFIGYIERTPQDFLENTPPVYKDGRVRKHIVLEHTIGTITPHVSEEDRSWVKRCFDPTNKVTFSVAPTLG